MSDKRTIPAPSPRDTGTYAWVDEAVPRLSGGKLTVFAVASPDEQTAIIEVAASGRLPGVTIHLQLPEGGVRYANEGRS